MSTNCDVNVIFLIYGQFGAIRTHSLGGGGGGQAWIIPPTSKQTPKEPNQIGLKFPASNNGFFSVIML